MNAHVSASTMKYLIICGLAVAAWTHPAVPPPVVQTAGEAVVPSQVAVLPGQVVVVGQGLPGHLSVVPQRVALVDESGSPAQVPGGAGQPLVALPPMFHHHHHHHGHHGPKTTTTTETPDDSGTSTTRRPFTLSNTLRSIGKRTQDLQKRVVGLQSAFMKKGIIGAAEFMEQGTEAPTTIAEVITQEATTVPSPIAIATEIAILPIPAEQPVALAAAPAIVVK